MNGRGGRSGSALEAGGNLDTIASDTTSIDGKVPALGQAAAAGSVPVVQADATLTTVFNAVVVDQDRTSTIVDKSGRNLVAIDITLTMGGGGPFDASGVLYIIAGNSAGITSADILAVPIINVATAGVFKLEIETAFTHIGLFYDFTANGADDTITASIAVS